jgi:hypothetical protein
LRRKIPRLIHQISGPAIPNLLPAQGLAARTVFMRTRLSICLRKIRYATQEEALQAALGAPFPLRPYLCDRCRCFHLTGRIKGKRMPRAWMLGGDGSDPKAGPKAD